MLCKSCNDEIPKRTSPAGYVKILSDLCCACLSTALDNAAELASLEKDFCCRYGHSPDFIREFGRWVLSHKSEDGSQDG